MTYQEKVKSYMKVFYILIALTIVELIFVEIPKSFPSVPHLPMVILICAASLAKAVYVAYYFMHLNHETPWLRKLIFLSLIGFFYAAVLIPDTIMSRKMVNYIPEPPRVFEKHGAEHELKPEAPVAPGATSTPAGASGTDAASVVPGHPETPGEPAAPSEGAEWK